MCLKPQSLPPIPDDTRAVAEQIYPPDHPLRRLGAEFADVLCNQDFADLYSSTGQPALPPALLALVTVLQATEHCSDRDAAEMVRSRIEWSVPGSIGSMHCICRWLIPALMPASCASSASDSSPITPSGVSSTPSCAG